MSKNRNPKNAKAKSPAKPKVHKPKAPSQPEADPVIVPVGSITLPPEAPVDPPAPKAMTGLDAATLVLKEAGEPLNAQDLIARILERGLWKTEGKTPAATIYAAMIREIKTKGSDSRFQKVDRGRFAAAG
jgi:hypothetical protein